ncbi:MAG: hypothetical protein M3Z27_05300 [Actinomycetota bacterium]|nr:hypothetical protein [Actinomycetota bacterium]
MTARRSDPSRLWYLSPFLALLMLAGCGSTSHPYARPTAPNLHLPLQVSGQGSQTLHLKPAAPVTSANLHAAAPDFTLPKLYRSDRGLVVALTIQCGHGGKAACGVSEFVIERSTFSTQR